MSPRAAPWLAWSLAGFSVALFVASVPLYVLARSAHVPGGWGADLSLGGLFGHALSLVFPLVGALIASRRPNNTIGWLFLTVGLLWTLSGMLDYYSVYGVAQPNVVPFSVLVAGINTWLWVPSVGLLGTYLLLLLPEGRLPSRRWPPGVALWSGTRAGECGHCSQAWINPGSRGVRNPFGLEGVPWVIVAALAADLLFALCMLASALALVYFGGVVVLQSVFRALTGPGVYYRNRRLDPCDRRPVRLAAPPGAVVRRSSLLPQEVRRREDPRIFFRQASRGDRPRNAERRPGEGGERDAATRARLLVAAPRGATEGRASRPAVAYLPTWGSR